MDTALLEPSRAEELIVTFEEPVTATQLEAHLRTRSLVATHETVESAGWHGAGEIRVGLENSDERAARTIARALGHVTGG